MHYVNWGGEVRRGKSVCVNGRGMEKARTIIVKIHNETPTTLAHSPKWFPMTCSFPLLTHPTSLVPRLSPRANKKESLVKFIT